MKKRKNRAQLLDEIHSKQQLLDQLDYMLSMAAAFSLSACGESKGEERKMTDYIPAESISQSDTEETAALQPEEEQKESSEETVSREEHIGVRNLHLIQTQEPYTADFDELKDEP